jgi:hypothetical protein
MNEGKHCHKREERKWIIRILWFSEPFLLELWRFRELIPLRTAKVKTVSEARLALRSRSYSDIEEGKARNRATTTTKIKRRIPVLIARQIACR